MHEGLPEFSKLLMGQMHARQYRFDQRIWHNFSLVCDESAQRHGRKDEPIVRHFFWLNNFLRQAPCSLMS